MSHVVRQSSNQYPCNALMLYSYVFHTLHPPRNALEVVYNEGYYFHAIGNKIIYEVPNQSDPNHFK